LLGGFNMPLAELAERFYEVLRTRVPAEDPRITYSDLVNTFGPLPPPYDRLQAFDKRLFDALGEIGVACHRHRPPLPALSSIVVQRQEDGTLGMPGWGYYTATHPGARTAVAKAEAWLEEFNRSKRTTYPERL
jgi:hypothetical protein